MVSPTESEAHHDSIIGLGWVYMILLFWQEPPYVEGERSILKHVRSVKTLKREKQQITNQVIMLWLTSTVRTVS